VLDHIPSGVVSLEKEIFPRILGRGLHGFAFDGYWVDAGTRESFLRAQRTILERKGSIMACSVRSQAGVEIIGVNMIEAAHLEPCRIGPHVYLERGAEVRRGAQISNSMVMAGAVIGEGAMVEGSLVGPGAKVDDGASVRDVIIA